RPALPAVLPARPALAGDALAVPGGRLLPAGVRAGHLLELEPRLGLLPDAEHGPLPGGRRFQLPQRATGDRRAMGAGAAADAALGGGGGLAAGPLGPASGAIPVVAVRADGGLFLCAGLDAELAPVVVAAGVPGPGGAMAGALTELPDP